MKPSIANPFRSGTTCRPSKLPPNRTSGFARINRRAKQYAPKDRISALSRVLWKLARERASAAERGDSRREDGKSRGDFSDRRDRDGEFDFASAFRQDRDLIGAVESTTGKRIVCNGRTRRIPVQSKSFHRDRFTSARRYTRLFIRKCKHLGARTTPCVHKFRVSTCAHHSALYVPVQIRSRLDGIKIEAPEETLRLYRAAIGINGVIYSRLAARRPRAGVAEPSGASFAPESVKKSLSPLTGIK